MLDVLDPHALRAPDEDRERVRGVDDVVDLDAEVARRGLVFVGRVDEHGEVVEERPFRRPRLAGLELDPRPADLDARAPGRAGRCGAEAEGAVLRCRRLRIGGAERDVIEVVVEVGLGLDEAERDAFCHLEVRLALTPPLDLEVVRQLRERVFEVVHAKGDVFERTALAWRFGREERQLPAPRVGADERERVGAVDHVHSEVRYRKARYRVAIREPVGDMVESLRVHDRCSTPVGAG